MGFGSKACMLFSYLNSICGFFIGWLFECQINSFSIPTVENKWDKSQKARACRNAAILYLVLAIIMTIKSWREDRRAARESAMPTSWNDRLMEFSADEADQDTAPLLAQPSGNAGPGPRGFRREGDSGTVSRRRNYGSAA